MGCHLKLIPAARLGAVTDRRIAFCLGQLEAALFASPRPLSARVLARRLELSMEEITWLLERYGRELEAPSRGLHLRETPGGWLLATNPIHEDVGWPARGGCGKPPLSAAAFETLAIVALHQPITARGVYQVRSRDSEAVLETLRKCGLIARARSFDGSAGLWRTTGRFLEVCGLGSLEELHCEEDFRRVFAQLREAGKPGVRPTPDDLAI